MPRKTLIGIDKMPYKADFSGPLFGGGKLVFKESGHPLTYLKNGYYGCALKQKGKCKSKKEKLIKARTLNRRFIDKIRNLKLTWLEREAASIELVRDHLDVRAASSEEIWYKIDFMDATLAAARQERTISTSDLNDLKYAYLRLLELNYPATLLVIATAIIQGLANDDLNARYVLTNTFVEKLWISLDGKIKAIKLEGLGDYVFQFLAERFSRFDEAASKLPIVDRISFPSPLEYQSTIEFFKENHYERALSYFMFSSNNRSKNLIKRLFAYIAQYKPREQARLIQYLKDAFWLYPIDAHLSEEQFDRAIKVAYKKLKGATGAPTG